MSARVLRRVASLQHPRFPVREIRAGRPLLPTHQNEMINAEARGRRERPRAPNVRFRPALPRAGPPMDYPFNREQGQSSSMFILQQPTFTGKDGPFCAHTGQAEKRGSHV
jgi:hypothetical protein